MKVLELGIYHDSCHFATEFMFTKSSRCQDDDGPRESSELPEILQTSRYDLADIVPLCTIRPAEIVHSRRQVFEACSNLCIPFFHTCVDLVTAVTTFVSEYQSPAAVIIYLPSYKCFMTPSP